jgi:hypothetical protein
VKQKRERRGGGSPFADERSVFNDLVESGFRVAESVAEESFGNAHSATRRRVRVRVGICAYAIGDVRYLTSAAYRSVLC